LEGDIQIPLTFNSFFVSIFLLQQKRMCSSAIPALRSSAESSSSYAKASASFSSQSAGGAALGAIGGNAGLGALVGAGAGLLGGYLYDQHEKGNIDF